MQDGFRRFARAAADLVGSPAAFLLGVILTFVWAATGSYFAYSDTWQLVINTGTSIGTFLIVFLIQNTQNRDAKVMHLKLDELIRAVKAARTELIQMEALSDEELEKLQKELLRHRDEAANTLERIALTRRQGRPILPGNAENRGGSDAIQDDRPGIRRPDEQNDYRRS